MRNYFAARFIQWNQHADLGGGSTVDLTDWAAGSDDDDLMNRVTIENQIVASTYSPDAVWTYEYPFAPTTVYAQWDKNNWVTFLNYMANFFGPAVVYRDPSFGDPPPELGFFVPKRDTNYTPRQGWKDDDGEERAPTPSDKGLGSSGGFLLQQISLAQFLTQIYGVLVVKPNPTPQLKSLLQDILNAIKKALARTITQAEIDKILAELSVIGT